MRGWMKHSRLPPQSWRLLSEWSVGAWAWDSASADTWGSPVRAVRGVAEREER